MIFKRYNQNLWGPLFVGAPGQLPTLPSPKSGPAGPYVKLESVEAIIVLGCQSQRSVTGFLGTGRHDLGARVEFSFLLDSTHRVTDEVEA